VKKGEICYFLETGGPGPNLLPLVMIGGAITITMRKKLLLSTKGTLSISQVHLPAR